MTIITERAWQDAEVPEPPKRAHDTTPDGRPYLVKVTGGTVWFVATPDGGFVPVDERLLRKELERHWPDLPTKAAGDDGQARVMGPAELFGRYGIRAENVFYAYTGRTRFTYRPPHTGDLFVRVITADPPPAVRHEEVMAWLALVGGDRLLDWLAVVDQLDHPTAALLLLGVARIGKSMIALGCARYFGCAVADYDDIFKGRFNGALLRSPIVALDESTEAEATSAGFRKLTANSAHAVEEKNRPTATLLGCPRLIVSSNEPDPLKLGREDLSLASENAIGERILMIDCDPAAAAYLAEHGGRAFTRDWIQWSDGSPGKLPETIAWLVAHRQVVHGSRFLVEGNAAEWAARIATRTGLPATILDAIAVHAGDRQLRARLEDDPPFRYSAGWAHVRNAALRTHWRSLLGDSERTPSHKQVTDALRKLAPSGKAAREGKDGPREWAVPAALVLTAAEERIGNEDAVRTTLGVGRTR